MVRRFAVFQQTGSGGAQVSGEVDRCDERRLDIEMKSSDARSLRGKSRRSSEMLEEWALCDVFVNVLSKAADFRFATKNNTW